MKTGMMCVALAASLAMPVLAEKSAEMAKPM